MFSLHLDSCNHHCYMLAYLKDFYGLHFSELSKDKTVSEVLTNGHLDIIASHPSFPFIKTEVLKFYLNQYHLLTWKYCPILKGLFFHH